MIRILSKFWSFKLHLILTSSDLQSRVLSQHCFTIPHRDLEMPAFLSIDYCIPFVSHDLLKSGQLHRVCFVTIGPACFLLCRSVLIPQYCFWIFDFADFCSLQKGALLYICSGWFLKSKLCYFIFDATMRLQNQQVHHVAIQIVWLQFSFVGLKLPNVDGCSDSRFDL